MVKIDSVFADPSVKNFTVFQSSIALHAAADRDRMSDQTWSVSAIRSGRCRSFIELRPQRLHRPNSTSTATMPTATVFSRCGRRSASAEPKPEESAVELGVSWIQITLIARVALALEHKLKTKNVAIGSPLGDKHRDERYRYLTTVMDSKPLRIGHITTCHIRQPFRGPF